MYHNINAGRLRDYVQFFIESTESDDYGQLRDDVLVFDTMAEVKTVSGNKIQDYGTTTNSTIITVLMYYDERASDNQKVLFEGVEYEVTHVNPDTMKKGMIVTCEVIKK